MRTLPGKMDCVVCQCTAPRSIQCRRLESCSTERTKQLSSAGSGGTGPLPRRTNKADAAHDVGGEQGRTASLYCLPPRADTLVYTCNTQRDVAVYYQYAFVTINNGSNILVYSWTLNNGDV